MKFMYKIFHKDQEASLPDDLKFVDELDLGKLKDELDAKFAQKTNLQNEFLDRGLISGEQMSRESTFEAYGIDEKNLFKVYDVLEKEVIASGVVLEYHSMSGFSEDKHYGNDYAKDATHEDHAETARSDGKHLILEESLEQAGGIQGRMYDLLHLAFGHMVQWSSDDPNLLLTKEQAWAIGYRNHEHSPDRVLDLMSLYEFEAGMHGVEALRQGLDKTDISNDQKERIIQYFTDNVYCDRDYIIQHYRGNHESFQKFWKFGRPIPPRFEIPKAAEFIQRHSVEIGLIRDNPEYRLESLPSTRSLKNASPVSKLA